MDDLSATHPPRDPATIVLPRPRSGEPSAAEPPTIPAHVPTPPATATVAATTATERPLYRASPGPNAVEHQFAGHVRAAGLAARSAAGRLVRVVRLVASTALRAGRPLGWLARLTRGAVRRTARLTAGAGRLAGKLAGKLASLARTITCGLAWPVAALARLVACVTRPARDVLARAGQRVERCLERRLGVTLRAPGLGGRIFLTTTGGLVLLIALGSVTLGMAGGGPAVLRALPPVTSAPVLAATSTTVATAPPVTEVPGVPIAATRTFLLTTYAPGGRQRTAIIPSSGQLLVGRAYDHLPRRGDDHLLTSEIVFPLLPAPAPCVARVRLRLTLLGSQGTMGDEGPYPLAVYPSALTGLAHGRIPAVVPTLDLLTSRPRGDLDWTPYGPTDLGDAAGPGDVPGPGSPAGPAAQPRTAPGSGVREVTADVTELYERWLDGMRTAKGKPTIPPGSPLVLAFRPVHTSVLGTWQQSYGGSDSAAPPVLLWSRRVHCR